MATAVFGNAALIGVAAAGVSNPVTGAVIVAGAALAGAIVDAYVVAPMLMERTRAKKFDDSSYDNGAGCPHALGLVRAPGQIIWASSPKPFDEDGGKGKSTTKTEVLKRDIAVAFHRGRLTATGVDVDDPGYVVGQVTDLVKRVFVNGTEMYITEDAIATTLPVYTYSSIIDTVQTDSETGVSYHVIVLHLLFSTEIDAQTAEAQLKKASVFILNNGNPLLVSTLANDHQIIILGATRSSYTVVLHFQLETNNNSTPFILTDFSNGAWPGGAATITLNSKEIWKKRSFESVTQYSGHTDQGLDPLMSSIVQGSSPIDVVPAHRGTAYLVFENFNVSDWGGTIPTFEVLFDAIPRIRNTDQFAEAVTNILYQGGHDMELAHFPNTTGVAFWPFKGVYWLGPTSAIDKIKDLLAISQFDMLESYVVDDDEDGLGTYRPVIEFRPRGKGSSYTKTYTIDESEVTCRKSGDTSSSIATLRRTPNDSVPNHISVTYYSPSIGLLQKTVTHNLPAPNDSSGLVRNDVSLSFRMSLDDNKAQQYAIQAFWDAQLQKDSVSLSLPPNYFDMCPGDLINTTYNGVPIVVRVVEVTSGSNGLIAVNGTINDNETGAQILDDDTIDPPTDATMPRIAVVETAPIQEADIDNLVLYFAGDFTNTSIKNFQIYIELGGNSIWVLLGALNVSRFISRITSSLAVGDAGAGVLDEQLVSVENQALMPTGVGDAGASDGYYRYVVGKTLVGVGGDDGTNIKSLARQLSGSTSAGFSVNSTIAHMPASLSGWLRYQLPTRYYVGVQIKIKVVPFGADQALFPLALTHTIKGTSLTNPTVYGVHSYRRDAISCIIHFYARVPGLHTVLSRGVPTNAAASLHTPYLGVIVEGIVVRHVAAQYAGGGMWSVEYLSAHQRYDYGTASDPTNLWGFIHVLSNAPTDLGSQFLHIGTNNYYESGV